MRHFRWAGLAGLCAVGALLLFTTAAAAQGEHGLGGSTNCASPTAVGAPVLCTYTIRNNSDDFGDTMRAHTVVATANSPGGSVGSGNVFSSLAWVFNGTVTCTGGTGAGTAGDPRIGATSCDIASGSSITSLPFSFYTANAVDATVPFVPMLADYAATDLCNGPNTENCPTQDLSVGVSSSTTVVNANIQINPPTADNPVGTTHVLTITVNAINGTLAAGTATANIESGPGSFVGSPTCNYAGGAATASCTVTITSLFSGTTVVSATSNISVGGLPITRTTNTAANTAAGGSGNASKNWTSLGTGRVTGGGSIFATINGVPNVRVTHGFELRCDPNDKRQSLEINWGGGNNFHLDKIINSVVCFDDPTTMPPPPPGTVIDTYAGNTLFNGQTGFHGFGYAVGTGTCNKEPATIYFILIDAGEPGTADTAEYHIVSSGCTLDAGPAQLLKGNHQFHKH